MLVLHILTRIDDCLGRKRCCRRRRSSNLPACLSVSLTAANLHSLGGSHTDHARIDDCSL